MQSIRNKLATSVRGKHVEIALSANEGRLACGSFRYKLYCVSCTSCQKKQGWRGTATYTGSSKVLKISGLPCDAHGQFDPSIWCTRDGAEFPAPRCYSEVAGGSSVRGHKPVGPRVVLEHHGTCLIQFGLPKGSAICHLKFPSLGHAQYKRVQDKMSTAPASDFASADNVLTTTF